MNRLLLSLALILTTLPGHADPIVNEKSEIRFVGTQMNAQVKGEFRQFSGAVVFDPESPETGHAELSVKTGSIDIGLDDGNLTLQQPEWFDVDRFPEARFKATGFRALGGERYEAQGVLAIKGHEEHMVVPVAIHRNDDGSLTASGEFSVRRLPFALGSGDWSDVSLVSDDVRVLFRITVSK